MGRQAARDLARKGARMIIRCVVNDPPFGQRVDLLQGAITAEFGSIYFVPSEPGKNLVLVRRSSGFVTDGKGRGALLRSGSGGLMELSGD